MLATPAKAPFSKRGWIYELPKYDGFWCLASKCGEVVRAVALFERSAHPINE